jgi:hypothetical protein
LWHRSLKTVSPAVIISVGVFSNAKVIEAYIGSRQQEIRAVLPSRLPIKTPVSVRKRLARHPDAARRSFRSGGKLMRNAVIPAPRRFDHTGGEFAVRSGTTIAYINIDVAPIVERFCLEVTRRTGLRLLPMTGNLGSNEPSIRVELTTGGELGVLSAPRGVSSMGERPSDERHSLLVDEHQVVVRAAEPVGVARGLSTLIQLLAAPPSPLIPTPVLESALISTGQRPITAR